MAAALQDWYDAECHATTHEKAEGMEAEAMWQKLVEYGQANCIGYASKNKLVVFFGSLCFMFEA